MSPKSKKLFNIIMLGVAFMFMFTAFQTCGNVAQTVITNLNNTNFHGSGYTSMAIIYGVFSASNLISPSVVAVVGPQLSMFVSGLFYSIYIAVFIQPFTWSFYTASVFIGIAAAESDRRTVFIALTVLSLVGTFLFFLIRKPEESNTLEEEVSATDESIVDNSSVQSKATRAVDAFKSSIKLYFTKEILLLSVTTAYTGLELTFFSGVYGTCIGAVNRFGTEEKSLIGLSGIFIGIGEILGGGFFGLVNKDNRFGRNPVVMLGIVVHFVAFYLIFYNIPNDAPIASFEGTDNSAYMNPSKELAIFCSFLLGLGDSCFNTQLLSILGFLYSEDSAPAFAVFKFVQSICAAVAFFYSNYLLLQWQLLIMAVVGFFGTISFFTVEWEAAAFVARGSDYRSI
ncbi:UNC93-like protein MFSD11 isoform X2 [Emys orbicularis]|uniref:UNC93-like protein MFSD11 isoform X2 n=1 Tax=Emys orbicularis TaxID=82168 RepID=UPI0031FDC73D